MLTRIEEIHDEGLAAIDAAASTEQLEELRVRLLGRKAELPNLLRGVGELEPAQRGQVGKRANEVRKALEARLTAAVDRLDASELDAKLITDRVDVTLPGDPLQPVGRLHLITQTWRELEDVFVGLGFTVVEGNEVETVRYNFDALNHDPTHPARGEDRHLLRRPTTPCCARTPRRCRCARWRRIRRRCTSSIPGRVYRRDSDATHTPQFHQVEGLAVDEDITLADLKGTLLEFSRAIFGDERDVRLRGHFFPFTEPSVEVDVSCFNCNDGWMKDGSRCPLCQAARAGSRSWAPGGGPQRVLLRR